MQGARVKGADGRPRRHEREPPTQTTQLQLRYPCEPSIFLFRGKGGKRPSYEEGSTRFPEARSLLLVGPGQAREHACGEGHRGNKKERLRKSREKKWQHNFRTAGRPAGRPAANPPRRLPCPRPNRAGRTEAGAPASSSQAPSGPYRSVAPGTEAAAALTRRRRRRLRPRSPPRGCRPSAKTSKAGGGSTRRLRGVASGGRQTAPTLTSAHAQNAYIHTAERYWNGQMLLLRRVQQRERTARAKRRCASFVSGGRLYVAPPRASRKQPNRRAGLGRAARVCVRVRVGEALFNGRMACTGHTGLPPPDGKKRVSEGLAITIVSHSIRHTQKMSDSREQSIDHDGTPSSLQTKPADGSTRTQPSQLFVRHTYLLIFSHSRIFFHVSSFMLLWMETTTSMSSSSVSSALPFRVRAFLSMRDEKHAGARAAQSQHH